ncbi:MAG: immunoglobulin-like domain-containing protein [Bacilli bacterium]
MKKIILFLLFVSLLAIVGCTIGENTTVKMSLKSGIDTVEINSEYVDPGVKATFGLLSLDVKVVSSTVNTQMLGAYEIVYEASYNGIFKTITRIVTVIDDTAPIIYLNPGVDTILIGENWVDAGVTITDNSNVVIDPIITGEINNQVVGDYEIVYQAKDSSNNINQIIRIVHVIDNE